MKLLWDLNIQRDHDIQHKKPDIFIAYKDEIKYQLLEFVLPGDKRMKLKEQEKLNDNNDLKKDYKISGTYGNL